MPNRKKMSDSCARSADRQFQRMVEDLPGEIADAVERTKRRADEIRQSAGERRERLRAATRGPSKQFRL